MATCLSNGQTWKSSYQHDYCGYTSRANGDRGCTGSIGTRRILQWEADYIEKIFRRMAGGSLVKSYLLRTLGNTVLTHVFSTALSFALR
jgi:hypothetical protein